MDDDCSLSMLVSGDEQRRVVGNGRILFCNDECDDRWWVGLVRLVADATNAKSASTGSICLSCFSAVDDQTYGITFLPCA